MASKAQVMLEARAHAENKLRALGHTVEGWDQNPDGGRAIQMCLRCRVYTLIDSDGYAYGPALLADCATLKATADRRWQQEWQRRYSHL